MRIDPPGPMTSAREILARSPAPAGLPFDSSTESAPCRRGSSP